MNLAEAINSLDPENEEHWTADGLPRMDALVELTEDRTITRAQVLELAPELTRETAHEIVNEDEDEEDHEGEADDDEDEEDEEGEEDDVLDKPYADVLRDYRLTMQAIKAIDVKMQDALKRREVIDEELSQLSSKNEILKRAEITHLRSNKRLQESTQVAQYLEAQKKSRQMRAERARRFIEGGTNANDVADQLRVASPLDAAMAHRRGRRGRPQRVLAPKLPRG